jgi:RimJ/RimL family protein N-acetyltransferase
MTGGRICGDGEGGVDQVKLTNNRLTLRDLQNEDKHALPPLLNDLQVSRYLALVPYPYNKKEAVWFVHKCISESRKRPRIDYELGIELQEGHQLVGVIGLTRVNRWNGRATLGYWLAKKYWRQGVMCEAIQMVLDFAFNKLELQRIDIESAVENIPSNRLIKKLGSHREGTANRYFRSKATGKYHDVHLYSLLRENWVKSTRHQPARAN